MTIGEVDSLKERSGQWQKYKKSFQKYYQKNKDYYKAYQKKYYQENKERINLQHKESLRKRLEANPQKIRKQQRGACRRWQLKYSDEFKKCNKKYRQEHIDKIKEYRKKYRLENAEEIKKKRKEWRASPVGRLAKKEENLRRRLGFGPRTGILKSVLNINFLKYGMTLCENCGVACWENYQFDHIISVFLGGTNEFDNFQILCKSCNLEKRTYAIDFRRLEVAHEPHS